MTLFSAEYQCESGADREALGRRPAQAQASCPAPSPGPGRGPAPVADAGPGVRAAARGWAVQRRAGDHGRPPASARPLHGARPAAHAHAHSDARARAHGAAHWHGEPHAAARCAPADPDADAHAHAAPGRAHRARRQLCTSRDPEEVAAPLRSATMICCISLSNAVQTSAYSMYVLVN